VSIQRKFRSFFAIATLALLSIAITSVLPSQQAAAASVTYSQFYNNVLRGNIDVDTDTFYCELVDQTYTPNKDTHTYRSDITGEVVGTGYSTGGKACTLSITVDNTNDRIEISMAPVAWPLATLTARGVVIYKRRGGAASADELVHFIDFLSNFTSTNGTFTASMATPIRIQN
jgi:hypothetical protein